MNVDLQGLLARVMADYVFTIRQEEPSSDSRIRLSFFNENDVMRSTVELKLIPATIAENLREKLVAVYDVDDDGVAGGSPIYVSDYPSAVIAVACR